MFRILQNLSALIYNEQFYSTRLVNVWLLKVLVLIKVKLIYFNIFLSNRIFWFIEEQRIYQYSNPCNSHVLRFNFFIQYIHGHIDIQMVKRNKIHNISIFQLKMRLSVPEFRNCVLLKENFYLSLLEIKFLHSFRQMFKILFGFQVCIKLKIKTIYSCSDTAFRTIKPRN